MRLEFTREFGFVSELHHEDQIGPLDQLGSQRILRSTIQSGRSALNARMLREDLFGRRAAPAVHAADEEDSLQFLIPRMLKAAARCASTTSACDKPLYPPTAATSFLSTSTAR